jgi:hypothetical protein
VHLPSLKRGGIVKVPAAADDLFCPGLLPQPRVFVFFCDALAASPLFFSPTNIETGHWSKGEGEIVRTH